MLLLILLFSILAVDHLSFHCTLQSDCIPCTSQIKIIEFFVSLPDRCVHVCTSTTSRAEDPAESFCGVQPKGWARACFMLWGREADQKQDPTTDMDPPIHHRPSNKAHLSLIVFPTRQLHGPKDFGESKQVEPHTVRGISK